jgi:hypothetical protein
MTQATEDQLRTDLLNEQDKALVDASARCVETGLVLILFERDQFSDWLPLPAGWEVYSLVREGVSEEDSRCDNYVLRCGPSELVARLSESRRYYVVLHIREDAHSEDLEADYVQCKSRQDAQSYQGTAGGVLLSLSKEERAELFAGRAKLKLVVEMPTL